MAVGILFLAWLGLATAAEFYNLNGRIADPCVNLQKLDAVNGKYDCTNNTVQPPPSTTFLLPSSRSPVGRTISTTSATITGKNFPIYSVNLSLGYAGFDGCDIDPSRTNVLTTTYTSTSMVFTIPDDWFDQEREIELYPRKLCWLNNYNRDGSLNSNLHYQWTGLRIGVVWNCDDNSDTTTYHCSQRFVGSRTSGDVNLDFYTTRWDSLRLAVEQGRTTCCPGTGQSGPRPGQCINTNAETCCGATALTNNMRCCSTTHETSSWSDGACPCWRSSASTDCPTDESCCLPSKYASLDTSSYTFTQTTDLGECYSWKTHRCCDVGKRYDPGTQQCCTINGLQSINIPCPCGTDSDCYGGQTGPKSIDQKCCNQTAPSPSETTVATQSVTCTIFANFPTGQGDYASQRCLGRCFDSRYQICCNGATCNLEYDACCNNTCCNQFTGQCTRAHRPGSPNSVANWLYYDEVYDICTKLEQLNHVNVFWVFIMPTAMLLAILFSLALVLVFANRVEHRARRALEKLILVIALLTVICTIPTMFAPVYKYGIVLIFASYFTIIAVAARKVSVYVAACITLFIVIFYLWDPFHGNDYLNLSSDRVYYNGRPDPMSAGLLHSIQKMHTEQESCPLFYDYFRLDPQVRDTLRWDNPHIRNFGYCSRGWITALLYFSGMAMVFAVLQFVSVVMALLIRGGFLKEQAEAAYSAAYQVAFGQQ